MPESGLQGCKIDFTTDPAKIGECHFIVVAAVYDSILEAGVHRASSIKVGEQTEVGIVGAGNSGIAAPLKLTLSNNLADLFAKLFKYHSYFVCKRRHSFRN